MSWNSMPEARCTTQAPATSDSRLVLAQSPAVLLAWCDLNSSVDADPDGISLSQGQWREYQDTYLAVLLLVMMA